MTSMKLLVPSILGLVFGLSLVACTSQEDLGGRDNKDTPSEAGAPDDDDSGKKTPDREPTAEGPGKCGAPAPASLVSGVKDLGPRPSETAPAGGELRLGLYVLRSWTVYDAPDNDFSITESNALRFTDTKIYESLEDGVTPPIERRFAYTVEGTDLHLTTECEDDKPKSGARTWGYTATSKTLVLFRLQSQSEVYSYDRISD